MPPPLPRKSVFLKANREESPCLSFSVHLQVIRAAGTKRAPYREGPTPELPSSQTLNNQTVLRNVFLKQAATHGQAESWGCNSDLCQWELGNLETGKKLRNTKLV